MEHFVIHSRLIGTLTKTRCPLKKHRVPLILTEMNFRLRSVQSGRNILVIPVISAASTRLFVRGEPEGGARGTEHPDTNVLPQARAADGCMSESAEQTRRC